MSLQTFQRAVVDLTLSPQIAVALLHGDTGALAEYDLTERERRRILDIVRQPGISVSCSLVRGNRLEVIAGVFPMTCVLLEPVLRQVLDELWADHRPSNYQLAGEDTAFAALVRRKMAAGELAFEYLDEIFAYEQACRKMADGARMPDGPDAVAETVVEFQHPPDALLPPLSRLTAPPPGLPRGRYRARVRLGHDGLEVEMH